MKCFMVPVSYVLKIHISYESGDTVSLSVPLIRHTQRNTTNNITYNTKIKSEYRQVYKDSSAVHYYLNIWCIVITSYHQTK